MQVRKVIKNRGHFPNGQAAIKLIYLALRNITKDWKMPPISHGGLQKFNLLSYLANVLQLHYKKL
ncbi:Transposase mutator family protein [Mycoavidus cysteinexigens]|uniref:Transposase mutator family protein n=1 Tax=Mycoavidus cysteinexigens TaxID=1553431 RepID=A0A2Z6ESH9_9BURK|nr:Transposase mutator family protein [Mycoavidus cysteinexigens]GAM52937.1 hypothetical protein EBME_1400 [bacterium endosymbiont of Mortierella elongata FMR23-6]GLR00865.1 hypothetical protein GCM10007934_06770 [Mycoavidus cysteinexigens]